MSGETWFVLEDDSAGDPAEVVVGKDGKLAHKDGRKVAYAAHGPRSRGGVDAEAERAKYRTREMKPAQPRRGYKTRESKAG
jgi:hypothetical protein